MKAKQELEEMPEIDIALGNEEKNDINDLQ